MGSAGAESLNGWFFFLTDIVNCKAVRMTCTRTSRGLPTERKKDVQC